VIRKLKTNHERGIRDAVFAPDGETLATVGYDSRLALWSLERLFSRRQ
jgi:WD40 repeat protein